MPPSLLGPEMTGRTSDTSRRRRRRDWGVESLEGRLLLSGLIAQGSGPGQAPVVRVFDADTGTQQLQFAPYGAGITSGVRVAVGDVTGQGVQDIVTVPGPGTVPVAKIFRATDGKLVGQFALPTNWGTGGVWVAAGDVNGDGKADIVVGPGLGTPWVRVYTGTSGQLLESFRADTAFSPGVWKSGIRVAVGDVNGDGKADIVATPVFGQSVVGVFDGRDGQPLARYRAFAGGTGGLSSLALADINGDRRLDVVVAAPHGSTAVVKVFGATTGTLLGQFRVARGAGPQGVQVAAVNLGGRGADELALSPLGGGAAGAAILAPGALRLSPAGANSPTVAYRLPQGPLGSYIAGDSSVAVSTPAVSVSSIEPPLSQALPVLDRLAYFDPVKKQFVPIQANDPRLVGKDITVISHGWAPGYSDWVNHEAVDNHHVLKWWETFPGQPGFDAAWVKAHPTAPDSVFLLNGVTASTIFGKTVISPTGLAQSILSRTDPNTGGPVDPNAVVLAYSWIDDSATPTWDFLHVSVPEDSDRSEALTTLNGERLAAALEQAVGTSFNGKIQLVGHSHGSKVVSVAAVALQQAGLPLTQVTTLDSPESDVTVAGDAANFNWYFLKNLTGMDRAKGRGPLVDNVTSEFGIPYSGVTLSDGTGAALSQVVDVKLVPDVFYSYDLGQRHSYAALWYSGSGEPSVTYGQTVGQYWSPLLPANSGSHNPVPGLPSSSEQNWGYFSQPANQQYVLNANTASTETITFKNLSAAPVSLTQNGTQVSSLPLSLRAPYYGQSGIAFDYQFTNYQPGDRLVILSDGKPAFVMDASLVGSGVQHATLSVSALPFEAHSLTMVLTSTSGNTSSVVTVSNFRTFYQPLT